MIHNVCYDIFFYLTFLRLSQYMGTIYKFLYFLYFSVTEKANILSNLFKLKDNHLTLENPLDMNLVTDNSPTIWSNKNGWKIAETEWVAKYVISERLPTHLDHYIKSFLYGIIEASTTLSYTFTFMETIQTVINATEFDTLTGNDIINNSSMSASNSSSPKINITYGKSILR